MPLFSAGSPSAIYLFIDAAYLRQSYTAAMTRFYGTVPEINWSMIRTLFGNPSRIYYYDAIDRRQVGDETPQQQTERISKADNLHKSLNSLPNWHVREGFVSRGRRASRRTQKAVDVQLAVDALEHAVAHNMGQAVFILGDLDFEPLFFSLNRFGIPVMVHFEEGTASEELLEAADVRSPMTLQTFNQMAVSSFAAGHVIPSYSANNPPPPDELIRTGQWRGRTIQMHRSPAVQAITVWASPGHAGEHSQQVYYRANDEARAELAFIMHFGGPIQWT